MVLYQHISTETDEVKKANLLKQAAAAPDLDAPAFLQFLNRQINDPQSSGRWKGYCGKVREWVIQKYKVVEKAPEPVKASPVQTQEESIQAPRESSPSTEPTVLQKPDSQQPESGPTEKAPVNAQEEPQESSAILGDSFQVDGEDLQKAAQEPIRKPEPKPQEPPKEDKKPHEGYVVYEEPEPDAEKELERKRREEVALKYEKKLEAEKAKSAEKKPPKKKVPGVPIPKGITVGWVIGMLFGVALLLPWLWLMVQIFSTIISKLMGV